MLRYDLDTRQKPFVDSGGGSTIQFPEMHVGWGECVMNGAGRKKHKNDAEGRGLKVWLPTLLGLVCAASICMFALMITQTMSGVMGDFPDMTGGRSPGGGTENARPLICIDAGHGYDDPGAMHENLNGLDEADINLGIALKLAEILKANGYDIFMTRESDEIPPEMETDDRGLYVLDPYERCELANEAEADLFLSIHCNSLPSSPSVSGMQLYYTEYHAAGNDKYAERLADSMEELFGNRPQVIANPKNDSYVVNRLVDAPSVLVETGFITNENDAALMLTESWQQQMAKALAEGIRDFLGKSGD